MFTHKDTCTHANAYTEFHKQYALRRTDQWFLGWVIFLLDLVPILCVWNIDSYSIQNQYGHQITVAGHKDLFSSSHTVCQGFLFTFTSVYIYYVYIQIHHYRVAEYFSQWHSLWHPCLLWLLGSSGKILCLLLNFTVTVLYKKSFSLLKKKKFCIWQHLLFLFFYFCPQPSGLILRNLSRLWQGSTIKICRYLNLYDFGSLSFIILIRTCDKCEATSESFLFFLLSWLSALILPHFPATCNIFMTFSFQGRYIATC